MKDLNAQYRAEGWGKITDAAFQGRVDPENVESAAREVARYAHETISELVRLLSGCLYRDPNSPEFRAEIEAAIARARI